MQLKSLYQLFLQSTGISTDTRSIQPGNIFFALKGEHFNGNRFALQALEAGATHVIADENLFPENEKIILVDDVLKMLQLLANHHRKELQTKVIAICGSNGKTTTKELISRVLETSFKIFSTKGNLNNHIGVPLTLLSLQKETQMAVIEMGANHSRETTLLCEIAEPDYGIITNNGKDHLEGYRDLEGVRKGNGELYDFLRKKNGIVFVSTEQQDLMEMSKGLFRVTYGSSENEIVVGRIVELFPFLKIEVHLSTDKDEHEDKNNEKILIETQLFGSYNFENVMAAVCMGVYYGVPYEKIQPAIASYVPSNNRSQLLKQGTNQFILDAYNANPSSMNAAIENFSLMPVQNKIMIAGDMLELGSHSEAEHRLIFESIQKNNFEKKIFVGPEFKKVFQPKENTIHFNDVAALKKWFVQQNFSDHYFLLKGSRLIGLEKMLS